MGLDSPTTLIACGAQVSPRCLPSLRFGRSGEIVFNSTDVSYNFRSDGSTGNEVLIRNLSARPFILSYWELLYCSGRWPRRKLEPIEYRDHDAGDSRIEPHTTHTLLFADERHYLLGTQDAEGSQDIHSHPYCGPKTCASAGVPAVMAWSLLRVTSSSVSMSSRFFLLAGYRSRTTLCSRKTAGRSGWWSRSCARTTVSLLMARSKIAKHSPPVSLER